MKPLSLPKSRPKQLALLKAEKNAYGGDLRKTRAGRRGARPLATRETMHLVLRSTKAKGDWSFRKPKHQASVTRIIAKFSSVYGVRIISMANVGNHLHLQIKLGNRYTFAPFIRAVTGAIAMAVTGRSRWTKREENGAGTGRASEAGTSPRQLQAPARSSIAAANAMLRRSAEIFNRNVLVHRQAQALPKSQKEKFWDCRPFTRIVKSLAAVLNLKDYIRINELEGQGYVRHDARFMLKVERYYARLE